MRLATLTLWNVLFGLGAVLLFGCKTERNAPDAVAAKTQAESAPPSCSWVPSTYTGQGDGCDCPLDGNTSCDPDCADNGEGSWCGCDYCFDGSGNEAEDPPPGWGAGGSGGTSGGTGGGGGSSAGNCSWVPSTYTGQGDGCDCPLDGDTACDPDCAANGEGSWCGCDYCFDGSGNEAEEPPPGWGEGGSGGTSGGGGSGSDLIDDVFEHAPDSTVGPAAGVGKLPSAGSVSADGAYLHTIPIKVPRGRAGMQPALALAYHSRGANGIAGVGWSLAGWSSITRCRKTYASGQSLPDRIEARQVENVQFDRSDELCLDGQKLLLHSGEYGRAGSEYRTEIDTFSRIELDSENALGRPARFTVYRKNGQIAVYESPDHPLERVQLDAAGGVASTGLVELVWPLETVSDRAGNVVEYRTVTFPRGLPMLASIHYTQCSGCGYEDAGRMIQFDYEEREDRRARFTNGVGIELNHRLSRITTYAPHPESGASTRVSQYVLDYKLSAVSNRSLLSAVTLCDGTQDDCRATEPGEAKVGVTTRFEWQGEKPEHADFITLGGEFVEPCTGDICSSSPHAFPVLKFPRSGPVSGGDDKFAIVDANGDGNDDLVVKVWPHLRADGTWENDNRSFEERIMFGDGDGYFGPSRVLDMPLTWDFSNVIPPWDFDNGRPPPGYPLEGRAPCASGDIIDWGNAIPVDLDQDGKQELIAPENRLCAWIGNRERPQVHRAGGKIYGNYAVLSLKADRSTMVQVPGPDIDSLPWNGTKLLFADLNGDGLPDMLQANVDYLPRESMTEEEWEASGAADEVWQYRLAQAVPGGLQVMYDAPVPSGLSVWNAEPWVGRGNLIVDEDQDGRQELLQQSFGRHRSFALNRDLLPEYHRFDEETNLSLHTLNHGDADDELAAVPLWWEAYGEEEPTPYAARATRGTTRFIDINGDGLRDAMNLFVDDARNVGFEVRINTGAGYRPPYTALLNGPEFGPTNMTDLIAREEGQDMGFRIADFNGDGLEDVLYVGRFANSDVGAGGLHIAYSDGATFSSVVDLPAHELRFMHIYRGRFSVQLAELDGNDLPDIVEMAHSPDAPDAPSFGRRQVVTRSRHRLPGGTDMIVAVQDEYGEAEKVTYDNLSHRTSRPGGDGRASRFLEPAHLPDTLSDEPTVSCRYPAKCVARGSVVRAYENKRSAREISETYRYFGARSDVAGRGWLGFRKVVIQDRITGRSRVLTFDQNYVGGAARNLLFHIYPNLGAPASAFIALTAASAPAPDLDPWVTGDGAGSTEYGLSSAFTPSWTTTRPLRLVQTQSATDLYLNHQYGTAGQSQERVTTWHDQYGNVWSTTRELWGVSGGNFIQQVDTEFDIRESDWLISLPRRQTRRSYAGLALSCTGCTESVSKTTFSFDERGFPLGRNDGIENGTPHLELHTQFSYDDGGLLRYVLQWDNTFEQRLEQVSYDERGVYPRDVENALGHVTRTIYDPRVDELAIVTDPNGVSTLFEYDGFGRPLLQRNADGSATYLAYGADSITVTDLGNSVQKIFFDAREREVLLAASTFDGGTVVQSKTYDALGHVVRTGYATSSEPMNPGEWSAARAQDVANSSIQLSAARYDAGGRIVSSTNGSNETTTFTYPGIFSTRVVDPEGRISLYERDARGSIIRLSQLESGTEGSSAVWATTEYRYAPQGGLAAVYMPDPSAFGVGLNRREFLYDEFGRVTQERGMNGLVDKVLTYSAFGDVEQIHDRGMITDIEYDELGRMIERRESTSGDVSVFEYDDGPNAIGQLVRATGIDGHVIDYRYDEVARLSDTIHTFANGGQERLSVGRRYDTLGRLSELRYPEVDGGDEFTHPSGGGLTVRYEYRNGQLERVLDDVSGVTFWHATERHPLGMVTGAVNGDGLESTWTHDPSTLRLQGYTADAAAGRAASIGLGYDRSGLVTTRTAGNTEEWFEYDRLSRLENYQRMTDGWIYHFVDYAYEKSGNISSVRVNASLSEDWPFTTLSNETYVYDPTVRSLLSRIDGGSGNESVSFDYDAAGRMLTRTTSGDNEDLLVLGYNSFDLPVAIESSHGVDSFFYDAFGTRVRKSRGLDSATYVEELYELHDFPAADGSGGRVTRSMFRIYGDSGPIAVLSQDWDSGQETVSYLHHDQLGSITFRTSGTQVEQLGYFPFGRRMGSFPSPPPEFASDGYTGHAQDDDLGLIDMRGRMYDPRTRRFLTPDPAIGMPFHAGGANLYSYVVNNPLNLTDPSGYNPDYPDEGPTIDWWQGDRGGSSGPSGSQGPSSMQPQLPSDYNRVTGPISPTDFYGPSYNVAPTSGPGDVSLGRGAGESSRGGASPSGPSSGSFGPTNGAAPMQPSSPGFIGNEPMNDSFTTCSEAGGCRMKTIFEIFGGKFPVFEVSLPGLGGAWRWLFGRGATTAAKALPVLTKGPGGKMLGEAIGHLRLMPGTQRAAAFEKFAEQITKATNGQWSAKAFNATNGRVFAGESGEALVFDGAGNMFRGHLSDRAAFVFREGGQIEIMFNALRGL